MTSENKFPKGQGSITVRKSTGEWIAAVPLPTVDGKRRYSSTSVWPTTKDGKVRTEKQMEALATKALNELRRKKAENGGDLPTGGDRLRTWLPYWLKEIAAKEVRPKTLANYTAVINNHILPVVGPVKLEKLSPEHVRKVISAIEGKGIGSATSILAYVVLSGALDQAVRDGKVTKNVAERVRKPRAAPRSLVVLSPADGVKVLQTVAGDPVKEIPGDRLGSRWAAALLTGARQGELLGLELSRVVEWADKDGNVGKALDLSWQLQRVSWQHGCGEFVPEPYVNTAGKKAVRKLWPCGQSKGSDCVKRHVVFPRASEHRYLEGGFWLVRPKSKAGYRMIPLVEPLLSIVERRIEVAAHEPNPHGLVWTADPKHDRHGRALVLDGAPLDSSQDNDAWHSVLSRAGVPDARLHDARHTTASLLLAAGVSEAVIIEIMGHSSFVTSMLYIHVDKAMAASAMRSIASGLSFPG